MKKSPVRPVPKPRSVMISLRLPSDLLTKIDALALDNGLKRAGLIRLALKRIVKTGV